MKKNRLFLVLAVEGILLALLVLVVILTPILKKTSDSGSNAAYASTTAGDDNASISGRTSGSSGTGNAADADNAAADEAFPEYGEDADTGADHSLTSYGDEIGHEFDRDAWYLRLVNADNPLPDNFTVETVEIINGHEIDVRAASYLEAMLADGAAAGMSFQVCSAYRSIEYQQGLFQKQIQKQQGFGYDYETALEEAAKVVQIPGHSEHNLGLAVDIAATYYQVLDDGYANTAEAQWLKENCARYGFILRYPEDKSDITNIIFEPWHFRFVGVSAATYIMDNGICLEEFWEEMF